ncbi:hypothetical protein HA402_009396 [Bradysia odoriphaga]|nr:hypothetical protein HA402_009396 [Bradysia odoriphaga]
MFLRSGYSGTTGVIGTNGYVFRIQGTETHPKPLSHHPCTLLPSDIDRPIHHTFSIRFRYNRKWVNMHCAAKNVKQDSVDKESRHHKRSKANRPTEPSTKIQDLNDDCIDHIFGYLCYDDVLAVSQVCQRFESRARDIFRRKRHNVQVFTVKANESKYLLRRIGPALAKLEIFFGEDVVRNAQTIDIATKCCVDSLTEITLHCLSKRNKLRKPFNCVNKLTLSFCDMIGHFKLIKWFPNLTCLTYHYTKNLRKFMNQNIPTMDTLNINYVTTHKETITMLTSNPQIRNLSLTFVSEGGLGIQHSLLAAIDKALPHLETLNLVIDRVRNFQTENLPPYFQQLKTLKIENYSDYSNTSLINNLSITPTNLEQLQLRFSDTAIDSHSYHCITKFKNLRLLQLMPAQRSLGIDDTLMLTNQLPLLAKIEQTVDFAVITTMDQ